MKTQTILALCLAGAFLILLGFVAFGATDAAPELSSWRISVTTVLAGLLGVPLAQGIKRLLPPSIGSMMMTYIAYAAAFIVALIVYALTGGLSELLSSPLSVLGNGSAVFAIMTLAYKTLKEKFNLRSNAKGAQ